MKKSIILLALGAAAGIAAYKKIESSGADEKLISAIEDKLSKLESDD